jgi:GAF domain-containing protein
MTADMTYMHLLHNIAHATNSSLKLDDTLQAILSAVQETLGVRAVIVRLLNPDADALEVAASRGVSQSLLAALQTKIVPGSINAQVMAGETVEIADLGETLRSGPGLLTSAPAAGAYGREDIGGLLAVPLMVRGRVIGSLSLYCAEGCGFSETVVTILLAAADLAAIAIENARLHTALFRIAQALTSTLELQPLLKQVLAATVMEMGLKAASVRLLDRHGKRLELVAAHGLSEHYLTKGTVEVSKSPLDRRLLAGETVALFDVAGEEGFQYPAAAEAEGIRSVLAVPLRVKEKVVGVIRVYSAQPRPFTPVGTAFLQSVSGLVAVAIENARLHQVLRARYEGLKEDVSEWYRFLALG